MLAIFVQLQTAFEPLLCTLPNGIDALPEKRPERLRHCSRRRSKEPCFVSGSKRTIGLSFRPESNLPNVPLLTNSTPVTSFLPAPKAADVLCCKLQGLAAGRSQPSVRHEASPLGKGMAALFGFYSRTHFSIQRINFRRFPCPKFPCQLHLRATPPSGHLRVTGL